MFEINIIERTNKDDEVGCEVMFAESEAFMLGFQRPDSDGARVLFGINGVSPRDIAKLFTTILKEMDEFCEKHPAVGWFYNAYKLQKFTEQLEAFIEENEQPREE